MNTTLNTIAAIDFQLFNESTLTSFAGTLRRLCQDGDSNTKLRKNSGRGFITLGQSMSPYKLAWSTVKKTVGSFSGRIVDPATTQNVTAVNSCPMASNGCAGACLDHQGLASVFERIRFARMCRTIAFNEYRDWYLGQLAIELDKGERKAARTDNRLAVRLNVLSDIPWEAFGIVDQFPGVQFYDYTAIPKRSGLVRPNYWVTLSRKENNDAACVDALNDCKNVAICFADSRKPYCGNRSGLQELPRQWEGFDIVDGDKSDLRFDDIRGRKRGRVIGLRLKAHSKAERKGAIDSGFAIDWRTADNCK